MAINYDKYYVKTLFLLFEIAALISLFLCAVFTNTNEKSLLFLQPCGFLVISLIFNKNYAYIKRNFSVLIIESLFFIRLCLLPCLYSFFSDRQLFEGNRSVSSNVNIACILMVYEFFVIQLSIWSYIRLQSFHFFKLPSLDKNIDISSAFVILLASYILIISIFFPQYTETFKSIFDITDADFTSANLSSVYNIGTVGRILKTLHSIGFQILRVIFPAFILSKIYKRNPNFKATPLLLFIFCCLQFVFLTSTFSEAVVSCLAIVLYYIALYPERKNKTLLFLVAITVGMIFLYFLIRFFVNTDYSLYRKDSGVFFYAAQIINAYFTGVDNVSAIFNIPDGYQKEAFISGVIGAIPFNSTLFGGHGNKLQYFFNVSNVSYGQIPPTIGAGYYYFGYILAPVISALFTYMSLRYYQKAAEYNKSMKYIAAVFCSIVFALGTVMYSPSITLSWYFSWGIPMLILTTFTNEKASSSNEDL